MSDDPVSAPLDAVFWLPLRPSVWGRVVPDALERRQSTQRASVSTGTTCRVDNRNIDVGLRFDRQYDDVNEGDLGNGGPQLTAETTTGNVELRPL